MRSSDRDQHLADAKEQERVRAKWTEDHGDAGLEEMELPRVCLRNAVGEAPSGTVSVHPFLLVEAARIDAFTLGRPTHHREVIAKARSADG